ncbi:chorismate mutase (plasmid) [Variovorax sp. V213]|uniref:chorismate mutase n=1 Tax=Variovorax sp. V213 TaxID=3065955 RepID=UPI0034E87DF5
MHMRVLIHSLRTAGAMAVTLATLAGASDATGPDRSEGFSTLVALSAARLDLSRQVALTKWDSRQPVADPPGDPREQEVIAAASQEAGARGLPGELATAFFTDQIEASKLVQFALMARWRREGGAPDEPRADLRNELRPALDRLRPRFIDELVATRSLRERPDCRQRLTHATARYVDAHGLSPLFAIGLDRGLARVCAE